MTPEKWNELNQVLNQLESCKPEERSAYLRELEQRDPSLVAEIRSMMQEKTGSVVIPDVLPDALMRRLAAKPDQQSTSVRRQSHDVDGIGECHETTMDHNAVKDLGSTTSAAGATRAADSVEIPGYEIGSELGRGGMGVVYKARHRKLNRIVALKMILVGGHASSQDVQRFVSEAEAVAAFQHPNIVQVYEIGEHQGLQYMALEYVDGGSLAAKIADSPLPSAEAAQLVEQIARGMNAAHQSGIVHRDLKPANVLLSKDGTPKVTDFGLAKKVESGTGLTHTGAIMGTPSYMAPEQARGEGKRVGPAADVYALGAILYACLTGRPPFVDATTMATLMRVIIDEPTPPIKLEPDTPSDLNTICVKCLNKEPHRRYSSASELAEELRRFQAGEPIAARPVGNVERFAKWLKRRPAVAALWAAVLLITVLGFAATMWQYLEAVAGRDLANASLAKEKVAKKEAQDNEGKARMLAGQLKAKSDELEKELDLSRRHLAASQLARVDAVFQKDPYRASKLLHDTKACPIDLRSHAWRFYANCCNWNRMTLQSSRGEIHSVSFSPDGKMIASGTGIWDRAKKKYNSGDIIIWDVTSGHEVAVLKGHKGTVYSVSFSPDGKTLASGSRDKTIRLWNLATKEESACLVGHRDRVNSVVFSRDGKTLASGGGFKDKTVKLWDMKTLKETGSLKGHDFDVSSVSFSPDGKTVASGSFDHSIKLWDVNSGQELISLKGHTSRVTSVSFGPNGMTITSGSQHGIVKIWNLETGQEMISVESDAGQVHSVDFSPDGKTIASSSGAGVKLWDVKSGEMHVFLGEIGLSPYTINPANSVCFSPDGKTLASGHFRGQTKLWDVKFGQELTSLAGHTDAVSSLVFSPNGATLASASWDKTIRLWDVKNGKWLATFDELTQAVSALSYDPDGKTLAIASEWAGERGEIRLLNIKSGQTISTLKGHTGPVFSVGFSPDGEKIVSGGRSADKSGEIKIWDVKTGREAAALNGVVHSVSSVAFNTDGKIFASGGGSGKNPEKSGEIKLWDANSGKLLASFKGHTGTVWSVCFSPDSSTLASASWDKSIKLWDVKSGRTLATLKGHTLSVWSVCFSPDGKTLASAGWDKRIKLWDVKSGQELASISGHTERVRTVCFSPDGKMLASGGFDRTVKLWDLSPDPEYAFLRGHSAQIISVAFTTDGTKLKSTDKKGNSLYWDLDTGQQIPPTEGFGHKSQRGPKGKLFAKIDGDVIRLIDLTISERSLDASVRKRPKPIEKQ